MSAVLRGDRTSAGGETTGAIARRGVRGGVASAGGAAAFATIGALGLATVGVLAFASGTDDGARAATRGAGLGRDAAASAGVGTCDGCANISVSSPSFARSWAIRVA